MGLANEQRRTDQLWWTRDLIEDLIVEKSPEERATVISSKDGLLTARFRDKDIEVVQFDDGGSNA